MKSIVEYLNERFGDHFTKYKYFPKNKDELRSLIKERIKKEGKECDLNDIDVTKVTDMSYLFYESSFKGDISNWNVSNVENMESMFDNAYYFNCDISKWDVSNVKKMHSMFFEATSFNQDISNWDLSSVTDSMKSDVMMFFNCPIRKEYKPKFKN